MIYQEQMAGLASRGLSVIKMRSMEMEVGSRQESVFSRRFRELEMGDGSVQESVGRGQRADIGGQTSEVDGPVLAQREGYAEQADDKEEGVFVHSFFAQEFVGDLRDFGVGVFAHGLIAG